MRRFFRITYYLGGVLLFVLIAIIGYTQTRLFKTYLRNALLLESHKAINGHIQFGTIEGNLITGFTIDSLLVSDRTTEFLSAERIELKYDPFGFLFNRIAVSNAILMKPRIHLSRTVDGTWNIARIIKPTQTDTNPSVWSIDIKRLELADAELIFTDSLLLHRRQTGESVEPPDSVLDYARVHLNAFSLVASVQIQRGEYSANIRDLSFSTHPDGTLSQSHRDGQFNSASTKRGLKERYVKQRRQTQVFKLAHMSGDFLLTKDEVSAKNVRIETSNSYLQLNAGLKDVDLKRLSSVEELKEKPVDLSLSANKIDTKELKQFLYPWVDFLDRELKLQLKVNGTFEKLNIEQITIQMPHTMVQLRGQIRNLHHPKDLEMSVYANDNFVASRDLLDCLPGLNLPDLTSLGPITYSLTYEGRPLDFKAHFIGSTTAGNVDVDGKMKINPKDITYSGTVIVSSLALGTILQDDKISSDLNARITIDGMDFDPRKMTGLAKVEVGPSTMNGLPIRPSIFVFDIADGLLRSHASASMGSGSYELSSHLRFLQQDSTYYSINAKIRSLDLAELLKDKQYESGLSFDLTATGVIGAFSRSDTTELRFYRSVFETETFESAEAKAIFNTVVGDHSELNITSTIGDLKVDGRFTPASFIAAWRNSYQLLTEGVTHRFRSLDSLRSFSRAITSTPKFRPSYVSGMSPLEAQFCLRVKDFRPVGIFIHTPLKGRCCVEGGVVGDSMVMQLNGKVELEQFGLRTGTDTLAADSASVQYSFVGVGYQTMFETFRGLVEPELYNFEINGLLFNQMNGRFMVKSDSTDFQLSTFIDSTARVTMKGSSQVRARLMEFVIPEIRTEIGQYVAENTDTVRLTLGRDGFHIQSLTMMHETEEASIVGHFSPTGISDLNISLNNFLLSNLKYILHHGPYARSSTQFGGLIYAAGLFRGNFKHPNIILDVKAEGVRVEDLLQNKKQVLGRVESRVAYYEHVLTLMLKLMSHPENLQASPDFLLSGSLPYDFALTREAPHKLEGQVDLTLKTPGLNLKFLDPFIPEISNLSGMITCDMRMKGPIDAPIYEGSMSIQHASLVFDPLGIQYIVNGDLIPAGDRIQLERFTIQNNPQERFHAGTMKVSGYFTLLGLKLKWFDLLVQGDLKVMSEDKRLTGQKLYGNLFAATGANGLSWQGDLSASTVKGEMLVKDAQLILPPEREIEIKRTSTINTIFKDDTSKIVYKIEGMEDNGQSTSPQSPGTVMTERNFSAENSATPHNSFLDGINYDMSIETQGPTQLRFVFNTQTSEELFADLQGRLYFNKTPDISRLTGQVEVSNRSYYNFMKKFEATGKLLFTGDVLNPELDVTATYQGTHKDTKDTIQAQSSGSAEEQVLVTLYITGTRNEPKTKISLQTKTYQEKDWKKWVERVGKSDEEANAISYIISGQFRDELTDQQRMGLIGTNLGFALASSMLTGPLSEAARKATYGVVQSVDMLYYGGQFGQAADLRVTGQVGEAVIRAGGRVFTGDFGNANVSVELPMSFVVGVKGLRNLILTVERRVESIQNAEEQRRASNGARLFYRITF